MATPHDALFKAFFSNPDHAADALQSAIPQSLVSEIDWRTLELEPGSYVDDELRERQSDLLYRVHLAPSRSILIHVLFEHQSTEDEWMAFRMLRYMVRIWERELASGSHVLSPIVAVVLHHSERGWRTATRFSEAFDARLSDVYALRPFVPDFELVIDDVSHVSDDELARRLRRASVQLVLRVLRDGRAATDPAAWLLGVRRLIDEVRRAGSDREVLWSVIRYLWEVARVEDPAPFFEAVRTTMGDRMKQRATTLAESVHRRGLEQGMLRGRVATLVRLLEQKFGPLDEGARRRVEGAGDDELTAWTDRILVARSLADVFDAS